MVYRSVLFALSLASFAAYPGGGDFVEVGHSAEEFSRAVKFNGTVVFEGEAYNTANRYDRRNLFYATTIRQLGKLLCQ